MPSTAFITPFRRVQAGWSVATTTTHLLPIILFVVAYERGGPALLAGCSVAIAVLGAAAASGVGALVDRFDLAIVLRAVTAMGSIALVACAVTALARWSGVLAIAFGSIGVAIFSTFRPLQAAALPWLVHTPRELARANVGAAAIESVASLVGPALGGAALLATTPEKALSVGVACAVLAPLSLLGLRMPPTDSRPRADVPANRPRSTAPYVAGLLALWRVVGGGGAAVLVAAQAFARGTLQVLVVILAIDTLRLGDDAVGWLWAGMGVGGLLGAGAGRLVLRYSRLARTFVLGVLLWGIGLVVISASGSNPWIAVAGMLVVGFGNALEDASMFTLVARVASREVVVRALSAIEVIAFVGMAVGSLAAPALADLGGQAAATLGIGIVVGGLALAYFSTFRAVDRRGGESADHADLLAGVEVFHGLPVVLVEHLASRLERHAYEPGAVVIREGDGGGSFHVVASGSATVDVSGSARPSLGPGDGFGEIALIRQSLRTATITAEEPLTTYSLDREVFLTAIQGRSSSAEALAERRLARDDSTPRSRRPDDGELPG